MDSPTIECVYCGTPTPRRSARQYTCPSCWKSNTANFGPEWYTQEWHRALLPDYVAFCHESERLANAASIEQGNLDFSQDDVVLPTSAQPVRHHSVYEAVYRLHVTSGLGARRISKALVEAGVTPTVTLRTINRYLKLVKEDVALAQRGLNDN